MEKQKQLHLHPLIVKWLRNISKSLWLMEHLHTPLMWSVFGLLSVYINDIYTMALSESSKLSIFADDMLLYKTISTTADYAELQQDFGLIYSWSMANLMTFNVSKCMLVSWRRNTVCPPINLNLNDHQLENIQTYKYLGLLLCSDHSWTHHIKSTRTKVTKLLGTNSVKVLTHKLWQTFIYPLWDHTWNMELKFGTYIGPKIHTHWRKFSSLDYGSVQGTGIRATKTY